MYNLYIFIIKILCLFYITVKLCVVKENKIIINIFKIIKFLIKI